MIHLLFVTSTLARSGPTNQLFNLVSHLDRTSFDPLILTLSPEPSDSRAEDFRALDIEIQSLNCGKIRGVLNTATLTRVMRKTKADIVHSQGIRADLLCARSLGNTVKIATVHNYPQLDYPMTYGRLKGALMARAHTKAWRRYSGLVGVSEAVAQNLSQNFSLHQACGIPNGVNTSTFQAPEWQQKRLLRNKLGLPSGARIWISTGHLSERKDPFSLLRAWMAQSPNDENSILLFLGDGPLKSACIQMASGVSNVMFLGRRSNIPDYLAASDIFLSASNAEGLPMAVIEAIASGLPVLLSDIPPHREIWQNDPGVGALFPLGDHSSLSRLIAEFAQRDLHEISAASRTLAERHYSAAGMANRYQTLYKVLLDKEASR